MTPIQQTSTTDEILRELGQRLERYRLQQNRTVQDVARAAGLGTATVARAEIGDRPTLATFVRLVRALGRIDALDGFLPAPLVSPIQLAELHGRERRRAGTRRRRRSGPAADGTESSDG